MMVFSKGANKTKKGDMFFFLCRRSKLRTGKLRTLHRQSRGEALIGKIKLCPVVKKLKVFIMVNHDETIP